ncbi:MAG TPA: response regulator transcription factor [Nitrospiraceae bacterium]|nr:response regulator transcription factor [Nitrospiraceae bacterium]
MKKPKVLLADDHSLVLEGFRRILEDECDIVGTAEDGRALLEAAARLKPHVVLLDISMPLLNGIDATRQLKKALPDLKVIFVTMHADPAYLNEAFKAGASGYLLKRSAGSELIQAIHSVLGGNYFVTPLLTKGLVNTAIGDAPMPATRQNVLTPRQREVLQLVAEGKAVKEIAQLLNISPKTVEFHKAQIMEQLELRTTAELTKYAMAHGLTTP